MISRTQIRGLAALCVCLIVCVSLFAQSGPLVPNTASVSFSANGNSGTADSNTVFVQSLISAAQVTIQKSASVTTAKANDTITFSLAVANSGGSPASPTSVNVDGVAASYVVVRDVVPANTSFQSIVNASGITPLFHLAGETNPNRFVSIPPPDASQVDAVVFATPSLAAGAVLNLSFSVVVHANASGTLTNTASIDFVDGTPQQKQSNSVTVQLPQSAPGVGFYTTDYGQVVSVGKIGAPLYVQGAAGACNLNPQNADHQSIRLTSSLSKDDETYPAVETGPNTGIFRILPSVPTLDARTNPVVVGDGIMELLADDKITATLLCSGKTAQALIFLDPSGIVFDSTTNAPIAGASVTLIDVTGAGNGGQAGKAATVYQVDGTTTAPSTVITGADGRFSFPSVAPSRYKLQVVVPTGYKVPSTVAAAALPPGHDIDLSGSYLGEFDVAAALGTVIFDVPADQSAVGGLFAQKKASVQTAQVGDFVDYTVEVKNSTGESLTDVRITDVLPRGFAYVKGTARLGGKALADPASSGATAVYSIGDMEPGASATLTYRVVIGAGAATGKSINTAIAKSGRAVSNNASAAVTVDGGVFSDRGYIVGHVKATCDDNGVATSFGVPGVRVYMEDGTYAITDGDGGFSFYGVRAQSHVLKVDGYTVARGTQFVSNSRRSLGDGASQIVDMKFGELRRADFQLQCTPRVKKMVEERRAALAKSKSSRSESESLVTTQLATQAVAETKITARPTALNSTQESLTKSTPQADAYTVDLPLYDGAPDSTDSKKGDRRAVDDKMFEGLDNKVGFVNLKDGQQVPLQYSVWVKGPSGSEFDLIINGEPYSNSRVGSRTTIDQKGITAWQYIGVGFRPGHNEVVVSTLDPFGNNRQAKVDVVLPLAATKVKLTAPTRTLQADGSSPVRVKIELFDPNGVRVNIETPVTLESTAGKWLAKDYDETRPGVQTYIKNGVAELYLLSPAEPVDAKLRVTANEARAEATLSFVPELRPMTAAGVAEYQLNFQHAPKSSIQSVNGTEGFEDSVRLFAAGDDNVQAGARTAMYLKGKILGENLLTMAYDSNRQSGERLFRDIQPDQFYPVYGDASTRGYDAQSTSKLYLRIDNGKSYVMWGDYMTTNETGPGQQRVLTTYSRTLTGMKQHYEGERTKVTSFATYDSFRQVVEEFPANGTSGPYTFKYGNGVENSEKVELQTRDRNQLSVVIKSEPQTRFQDYEFEPFTGRLMFKSPIPTLDHDGNPLYIRVTYEVEQGGERFWAGGFDTQYQVSKNWAVGAIAVGDANPEDPNQLYGLNTSINLPAKAVITGELAETHHQLLGSGLGYRFAYKQETKRLKADAYFGRTALSFQNMSSMLSDGRGEAGGRFEYNLDNKTRFSGQFIRTEDVKTGGTQVGAEVGVERRFSKRFKFRAGLRHSQTSTASPQTTLASVTELAQPQLPSTQFSNIASPNEITSLSAKVTVDVPHSHNTQVGLEFEQDVQDLDKHRVVADAKIPIPHGRFYASHEFLSSLGNVYSLSTSQSRMATLIGVETDYLKHSHLFTEFRERDELVNRNSEAAIGLRNTWKVGEGVGLTAGFESIRTFSGKSNNSYAATTGVEFRNNSDLHGSARVEYRAGEQNNTLLTSLALGKRLNQQWTLLSRSVLLMQTGKGEAPSDQTQARFQAGAAYRGSEASRWDALTMFEYRLQETTGAQAAKQSLAIFSSNVNYQPLQGLAVTTRYASKWNLDNTGGLDTSAFHQLFSFHVTKDVSRKFDVGLIGSVMSSSGFSNRQQNLGAEIGYQLKQNLWLSTGYNFLGFYEKDLPGGSDARQGAFVRLRFKFDENILKVPGRTQFKRKPKEQAQQEPQQGSQQESKGI